MSKTDVAANAGFIQRLDPRVEVVARTIDPEIFSDDVPVPTRSDVIDFHARRQRAYGLAVQIIDALNAMEKA